MNSKHSFDESNTNTLLGSIFTEFSTVTCRPMQLLEKKNKYILKEFGQEDLEFISEEEIIKYLRSETSRFVKKSKMSNL